MISTIKSAIKVVGFVGGCLLLIISHQNCSRNYVSSNDQFSLSKAELLERKAMVVLTTRCSSCHNADIKSGGIDTLNINEMLALGAVVPGEPSLSPLFTAVQSGRMPPAKFLSQNELEDLYNWIADGSRTTVPDPIINPPPTELLPTFASINRNILQAKCLGCHNSNSTNGVNFGSYMSTMNTVQRTLPLSSGLYTSVAVRRTMPKGSGASLSDAENKAIFDWISAGALNN